MQFEINNSIDILRRTPSVLTELLKNISLDWSANNEGGETWSPFDVVGHLIHGEEVDWKDRIEIILGDKSDKTFKKFDRFAQFESSKGKSLNQLLDEFTALRNKNIHFITTVDFSPEVLRKTGIHPAFGSVTLSQLLSTWVVHDLNHISQICRVMAHQYEKEVGPWIEYLRILKK